MQLLFSVETQRFSLEAANVEEVFQATRPLRAHRPPFGCLGVVRARGRTVPVLDLGALLRLRRPLRHDDSLDATLVSRFMLLTRIDTLDTTLLVDRVIDVVDDEMSSDLTRSTVKLDLKTVLLPARRQLLGRFVSRSDKEERHP